MVGAVSLHHLQAHTIDMNTLEKNLLKRNMFLLIVMLQFFS